MSLSRAPQSLDELAHRAGEEPTPLPVEEAPAPGEVTEPSELAGPGSVPGAVRGPADGPTTTPQETAPRRRVIRLSEVVRPASATPLVQSGDSDLDERRGRLIIDLALRTGEALLAAGTQAADVVATVLRLTAAFGVRAAHVDITYTSITVSIHRGLGEDPLSVMRIVRARVADYLVVERLETFVDELAENPEDLAGASARLEEILHAPRAYRPWVTSFALAMMGAAISALLGADMVTWVITFVSTLLIDQTLGRLGRWGLPPFFGQAVAAAIPTMFAVAIYLVEEHDPHLWGVPLDPPGNQVHSLVVAAGIIVLLAGLGVVGTAQDALDGYYVTAAARAFEVVMMTLGVTLGVALVLSAAHRAGVQMTVLNRPYLSDDLVTLVGSSFVFCFFAAIATYASLRAAALSSVLGATVFFVFWTLDFTGAGYEMRVFLAVTLVSVLANWLASLAHVPALALTTAIIVPFLPGGMVYRGLFKLMDNDPATYLLGVQDLLGAVASGLALAGGVSLGTWVARTSRGLTRSERKASRVVET